MLFIKGQNILRLGLSKGMKINANAGKDKTMFIGLSTRARRDLQLGLGYQKYLYYRSSKQR